MWISYLRCCNETRLLVTDGHRTRLTMLDIPLGKSLKLRSVL